jgi:hypothetical protein
LNSKRLTPIYKTNFSSLLEGIDSPDLITIGASSDEKANFLNKTHFQGQIKHFNILPFEITESSIPKYSNSSEHNIKESSSETQSGSPQDFEIENLYEESILNLNTFVRISKLNVHEEIMWSNPYSSDKKQLKKKKSFLDPAKLLFFAKSKQESNSDEAEKLEIRSHGVFYLEKSKFVDLLFSIGDVDIFIMCIALLINFKKFEQKSFG